MIENQRYLDLLDDGLSLDHYFVLCNIKNGIKPSDNKRIQGFLNLLTKKDYLSSDGVLTEKAMDIVHDCTFSTEVVKESNDFEDWIEGLHKRLEDKMVELTGKKQIRDRIGHGAFYSFLPNSKDLGRKLHQVIRKYKLTDRQVIEDTLMRFLDSRATARNWFPLLQYYIMKDNLSQMVTDMQSGHEVEATTESRSKFV